MTESGSTKTRPRSAEPVSLSVPCVRAAVEPLHVGQPIELSGMVFTGRDRFHKFLAGGGVSPVPLADAAIYHCGPVIVGRPGAWQVRAAGPTTSMREEPYMAEIIRRFGVRVIIGKGGMGQATQAACREQGCVYLQAVGGAASVIAEGIAEVAGVHLMDQFGAAEAVWMLRFARFRAVVTMDAHGESLYEGVEQASRRAVERVLAGGVFTASA